MQKNNKRGTCANTHQRHVNKVKITKGLIDLFRQKSDKISRQVVFLVLVIQVVFSRSLKRFHSK